MVLLTCAILVRHMQFACRDNETLRNNCQRILLYCMKIRFLGGFLRHNQEKVSLCNFFFHTFDFGPELHVEVIDLFSKNTVGNQIPMCLLQIIWPNLNKSCAGCKKKVFQRATEPCFIL